MGLEETNLHARREGRARHCPPLTLRVGKPSGKPKVFQVSPPAQALKKALEEEENR